METSIVRENLMTRKGYTPYCGSSKVPTCMYRTTFNGQQFKCKCGWISSFPDDFIFRYKVKWDLK